MSVPNDAGSPIAIGRLGPDGPWVGFQARAERYRLAVGSEAGLRSAEAGIDLLLGLAIAYFTEALDEPPPELAATQQDLSGLVAHLADREGDPGRRRLLAEAMDAIDDGLPGDAVASRLDAARQSDGQRDPIELIRTRATELLRGA